MKICRFPGCGEKTLGQSDACYDHSINCPSCGEPIYTGQVCYNPKCKEAGDMRNDESLRELAIEGYPPAVDYVKDHPCVYLLFEVLKHTGTEQGHDQFMDVFFKKESAEAHAIMMGNSKVKSRRHCGNGCNDWLLILEDEDGDEYWFKIQKALIK